MGELRKLSNFYLELVSTVLYHLNGSFSQVSRAGNICDIFI